MTSDNKWHYVGCHPRRLSMALAAALMLPMGCASTMAQWWNNGWAAGYGAAEARRAASGSEMLIYFRAVDQGRPDPTFNALQSVLKQQTMQYVLCSLYRSYEPDRRYVAQYGVERAPALIVVHGDGTFHARTGAASSAQVTEFLAAAQPPGSAPIPNQHIPRATNYAWHSSLESAETAAQKTGQSILIVFDRWWLRERGMLEEMLDHREVHSRFWEMVHCRPSSILVSGSSSMDRFGVVNLPALVVVRPDGSHHALELPTSYEAIVRFADRARSSKDAPTSTGAAGL